MAKVIDSRHKDYEENSKYYEKWRLAFRGGEKFKEKYLTKRPKETSEEFNERKNISYTPAFAKEAILEVARSINQRVARVNREGGTSSYVEVAQGEHRGIDRKNSSMSMFIGKEIIEELLVMGSVGIYIDNVKVEGKTKASIKSTDHPYVYTYKIEDIMDWEYLEEDLGTLKYVILREDVPVFDAETGLRKENKERYRFAFINAQNTVTIRFYDEGGKQINKMWEESSEDYELALTRIPFIRVDAGLSLMEDVADYQVAHLHLASSDMNYAYKSNIPFYIEQKGSIIDDMYARKGIRLPLDADGNPIPPEQLTDDQREKFYKEKNEIEVGGGRGRTYPKGLDAPSFIHPDPDPLRVSMEKQTELKRDIRELVTVAVREIGLRFQSEGSKQMNDRPMEDGLSYIGLILERAENQLAEIYAEYEGKEPAIVKYPTSYRLLTEAERQELIKKDRETLNAVPSAEYRKEVFKSIVHTRFSGLVAPEVLKSMLDEVENSKAPTSDPEVIRNDVELGILSAATAAEFRGYEASEVEKAQEEKAERLKVQLMAQSAATPDLKINEQQAKDEKAASQQDGTGRRGRGRSLNKKKDN